MDNKHEIHDTQVIGYPQLVKKIIVPEGLTNDEQTELYEPLSRYVLSETPSALYRFRSCNERNFSAFDKGQLWFSRAEMMNDDFDSLVYFDRETILDDINQAFKQLSSDMKNILSHVPVELHQVLQNMQVSVNSNDLLGFQKTFLDYVDQALESVSSQIRKATKFACFSDDVESPLMWGHYADSSRGFALAYDFRNSGYTICDGCANKDMCQDKKMCTLYPMVYTNERLDATQYINWLLQKNSWRKYPTK